MNAFSQMIDTLTSYKEDRRRVTLQQYEEFKRHWLVYALEEKRYGQAFCEHFGYDIMAPLYWFKDNKISEEWILDNYII